MSFLLVVVLLICVFPLNISSTNIAEIENIESENIEIKNENEFNKIHFYFDNPEYSIIDNREELTDAVNKLINDTKDGVSKYSLNGVDSNEEIQITVEFESDFFNTEAYHRFAKEREEIKDSDDILDFRKRLNAYSEEYHTDLIEKTLMFFQNLIIKQ